MARQIQLRRGTKAQNELFTGAEGELTMDTDTKNLRIHDGSTAGGTLIPTLVDFQRPTSSNNYTWYRLYSDGWVEQGGHFSGNAPLLIVLPITMTNTGYSCLVGHGPRNGINWTGNPITLVPQTTTTLGVFVYGEYQNMTGWWEVKGYAA